MNINPKISMVVGHECTTMKEYDNYNSHRVCHTPHSTPCLLLLFCFLFLLVLSPHLGYVFFSCNPKWCVLMLAFRKKNVVAMFFLKQNLVQTTLFCPGEEKKGKGKLLESLVLRSRWAPKPCLFKGVAPDLRHSTNSPLPHHPDCNVFS